MRLIAAIGLALFISTPLLAAVTKIPMRLVSQNGKSGQYIGYVNAKDTQYGLLLTPHLKGLPPGIHGFHVHTHPTCKNFALDAGGHLDPFHSNKHLGPYKHGHLGDLPVLIVNKDGTATLPVLAPRLRVEDILHHSLMIHAGGDNYSDHPKPLGGGGKRIACGVIKP